MTTAYNVRLSGRHLLHYNYAPLTALYIIIILRKGGIVTVEQDGGLARAIDNQSRQLVMCQVLEVVFKIILGSKPLSTNSTVASPSQVTNLTIMTMITMTILTGVEKESNIFTIQALSQQNTLYIIPKYNF